MEKSNGSSEDLAKRAIEVLIKAGLILLVVYFAFIILKPFIALVLWGIIIAVSLYPAHQSVTARLGGRKTLSATLLSLIMFAVLIIPSVLLSDRLIESSQRWHQASQSGEMQVPQPSTDVKEWPLIGERVFITWQSAANNLPETLEKYSDQLKQVGGAILKFAAAVSIGVLQFVGSIIIAGVILAQAEAGYQFMQKLTSRLVGESSDKLLNLMTSTIRSVTKGVLGVAVIQAIAAGVGFLFMEVPAASLLTILCFVLALVQISIGLITIPAAIYIFSVADTLPAILFLIYMLVVGMSDSVLKPILLGRGVDVPMMVIFTGVIGGFIAAGIIGLFIGAVVLVVAYRLMNLYLLDEQSDYAKMTGSGS